MRRTTPYLLALYSLLLEADRLSPALWQPRCLHSQAEVNLPFPGVALAAKAMSLTTIQMSLSNLIHKGQAKNQSDS